MGYPVLPGWGVPPSWPGQGGIHRPGLGYPNLGLMYSSRKDIGPVEVLRDGDRVPTPPPPPVCEQTENITPRRPSYAGGNYQNHITLSIKPVFMTQEERDDVPGTVGRSGYIVADWYSLSDGTLDRGCARTRYVPRRRSFYLILNFAMVWDDQM